MVRSVASLVLAAALLAPGPGSAQLLFRLTDPRLTEASGIAAGIRSPGVLYMQNDSGDSARFFALDRSTGRVLAEIRVTGATNVDWEDLAVAPDSRGVPSVWIADTGDNSGRRDEVQIYRVDEPSVAAGGAARTITTAPAQVWRLRYPEGHPDTESLAVTPTGQAFVITKSPVGISWVYQVPPHPGPGVQVMRDVGRISFPLTGTEGGPAGPLGNVTATGAALSRDGRILAVRTYTDAWFWRVPSAGLADALGERPAHIPLPPQPQGEGIAFVGNRVVIDSERVRSRVWSVPVPQLSATPSRHPDAPHTSASSGPPSSSPPPVVTASRASQRASAASSRSDGGVLAWAAGGIVAVAALGGLAWRTVGRRGR
jgi:hypothetical protein